MVVTTVNTHFSFYDQNILGFSMFTQRFRQPIEKVMIYSWSATFEYPNLNPYYEP